MAEREQEEFIVTDRRKFRFDGDDVKHVEPQADQQAEPAPAAEPAAAAPQEPAPAAASEPASQEEQQPQEMPAPSAEDIDASSRAYTATAERLDDVMRATNPGMPHDAPVNFERVIQSLYVSAIVQLGLNTPPGQQMRVDLMGARNTIDMLAVLAEKTKGNLNADEEKLLQTVLFELRMSFLEVTQMLAQQAQAQAVKGGAPAPPKVRP